MRIVNARRISQVSFFLLFLWFCWVSTVGTKWWQLRGWPVNWFLQLDPLAAFATVLTTGTLYRGLAWALVVMAATVILGRFFCGWVCPFGTLHQAVGYLGRRKVRMKEKAAQNRYRPAQQVKYAVLAVFLGAAFGGWLDSPLVGTLQTGLLDPIPFFHRSVNLVVLALGRGGSRVIREGWLLGVLFGVAVGLNLYLPRFYCRFVCPLGAFFAVLSRNALWRIGKTCRDCSACGRCEAFCEGACEPAGVIRTGECVLCMNCLDGCREGIVTYQRPVSAGGEIPLPDLKRRRFVASLASGVLLVPILRLDGTWGPAAPPRLVRPPGALPEPDFLRRCLKCGQCVRVCPTRVIQPAGLESGIEALWTPVLDFRAGSSGCQYNCVACSHICPTAALRPLSVEEKQGTGPFSERGPLRLGTAFVDRGRCLPWAMDRPCIVCQENCPVSPKAISTRDVFVIVRDGRHRVTAVEAGVVWLREPRLVPGTFATGDFFCAFEGPEDGRERRRYRITGNSEREIRFTSDEGAEPAPYESGWLNVEIRLRRPQVDPERCVGCGICEHECPVTGLRAIRVTAENESRHPQKRLVLPR
jgi:polyferredoxin